MTYPALDSVLVQTELGKWRRARWRQRFWKYICGVVAFGLVMAVAYGWLVATGGM